MTTPESITSEQVSALVEQAHDKATKFEEAQVEHPMEPGFAITWVSAGTVASLFRDLADALEAVEAERAVLRESHVTPADLETTEIEWRLAEERAEAAEARVRELVNPRPWVTPA